MRWSCVIAISAEASDGVGVPLLGRPRIFAAIELTSVQYRVTSCIITYGRTAPIVQAHMGLETRCVVVASSCPPCERFCDPYLWCTSE